MISIPNDYKNSKTNNMNCKSRSSNKSTVWLITLTLLFTLISCSNVKKEPGRAQQGTVPPLSQEQPGSAIATPVQSVNNSLEAQPSPAQNSAEVMLNPPHGQPFHRCDIPVGAPLPSANTNNQAATNQVQATAPQVSTNQVQTTAPQVSTTPPNPANNPFAPTIENASRVNPSQARTTTTANNGTKPRLNPPHGQPFHRCDIPVGSPLPN
jgi:hypothetical protein